MVIAQRLRERFLAGGAEALPDYELMELLLFIAIPQRDTKPLAKALIAKFGSFADVIAAPVERLLEVDGVKEGTVAALKTVEAAALRLARAKIIGRPALASWEALFWIIVRPPWRAPRRRNSAFFLSTERISCSPMKCISGARSITRLYPREVVKRALELGASAIILVHNHPSGDPTPSRADIAMTREIAAATKALKIEVHDHRVTRRGKHASFKALGLL